MHFHLLEEIDRMNIAHMLYMYIVSDIGRGDVK